jgi:hypothetical protein
MAIRTATGLRTRRTLAAVAVTLVSVTWGGAASAAPQKEKPVEAPVMVRHTMSSCGNMDGF